MNTLPRLTHVRTATYLALCAGVFMGCDPGKDPPTQTDDGAVPSTEYTGDLQPLPALTSSGGNCVTNSGGMVSWDGVGITDHETVGYEGSLQPQLSSVKTGRSGACAQETAFVSTSVGSGAIDSRSGDTWHTSTGDLTNCYGTASSSSSTPPRCDSADDPNSCSGEYTVTIVPEGQHLCSEYDTVRIDLSPKAMMAMRRAPEDSDCASGSGRFKLVPAIYQNRDQDSGSTVQLLPFQVSGTGVMTGQAWVTQIDKVSAPTGKTIRVLKTDAAYGFDSSDALANASTVSIAITSQHAISSGVVSGNPPFVLEEIADADFSAASVDMTWSCGSGAASVSPSQGYSFSLEDIGCDGALQRMTIRVPTSPNRLEIEQYGNPNWSYVTPTTTVQDGKAFSVGLGDFNMDGVVLSAGGSNAQVRLDNIQFGGVDICTTGTYTFGLE